MLKSFFSIATLFVALLCFSVSESNAQIPGGSFGMGSTFSGGSAGLNFNYAISNNFDLGIGVGYSSVDVNTDVDDNEVTMLQYGLGASYFLGDANAAVNPWIGLNFAMGSTNQNNDANITDQMNIGVLFGAQAMLVKNVYLRAGMGIGISNTTTTTKVGTIENEISASSMSLSTAQIGVIFYF